MLATFDLLGRHADLPLGNSILMSSPYTLYTQTAGFLCLRPRVRQQLLRSPLDKSLDIIIIVRRAVVIHQPIHRLGEAGDNLAVVEGSSVLCSLQAFSVLGGSIRWKLNVSIKLVKGAFMLILRALLWSRKDSVSTSAALIAVSSDHISPCRERFERWVPHGSAAFCVVQGQQSFLGFEELEFTFLLYLIEVG